MGTCAGEGKDEKCNFGLKGLFQHTRAHYLHAPASCPLTQNVIITFMIMAVFALFRSLLQVHFVASSLWEIWQNNTNAQQQHFKQDFRIHLLQVNTNRLFVLTNGNKKVSLPSSNCGQDQICLLDSYA